MRGWLGAVLVAWAVVWGASWLLPWQLEPTGDGFTRGMNRLGAFFALQLAALVPAVAALVLARRLAPGGWLRRAGFVPLAAALVLVCFIAGLMVWAQLS